MISENVLIYKLFKVSKKAFVAMKNLIKNMCAKND